MHIHSHTHVCKYKPIFSFYFGHTNTYTHIQFNWQYSCFTRTCEHPLYNHSHCQVDRKYKVVSFKVLVFCQISCVYIACANSCCIIAELTPKVLFFVESREILFLHIVNTIFILNFHCFCKVKIFFKKSSKFLKMSLFNGQKALTIILSFIQVSLR